MIHVSKIITAPDPLYKVGWSLFLAGSIEMGFAKNWQQDVIDSIINWRPHKTPIYSLTILNPRRDVWDNTWLQTIDNPYFYRQVSWELEALDKATRILFYFDPDTKSPISLLEFGMYAKSGKAIVVCPLGFYRRGNIEVVCEKYGVPLFEEFNEDLLELIYFDA